METGEGPLQPAREKPYGEKVKQDAKGLLGGLAEFGSRNPGLVILLGLGGLAGLEAGNVFDETLNGVGIGDGHGLTNLDEIFMKDDKYIEELRQEGYILNAGEDFNGKKLEADSIVFDPGEPDATAKELNVWNLFEHWITETSWIGENIIDKIEDFYDQKTAEETPPAPGDEVAVQTSYSKMDDAEFLETYKAAMTANQQGPVDAQKLVELQREMSLRIPDKYEGEGANLRELWEEIKDQDSKITEMAKADTPADLLNSTKAEHELYRYYLERALGPAENQLAQIEKVVGDISSLNKELRNFQGAYDASGQSNPSIKSLIQEREDQLNALRKSLEEIFKPASSK